MAGSGVGTLMRIALIGALVLGQFAEAAALAFLFSISEALEDYSLTRTRRGLRGLPALVPTQVIVLREGTQRTIEPGELVVGDRMVVRAGERVASDGIVREGRSAVDTSAITGESLPVEIGPGDTAFAGSVNATGALTIEATATVEDNSLAKVVRIVDGGPARLGKPRWISPGTLQAEVTRLQDAGTTVAVIEHDHTVLGIIGIRGELRPEAAETISVLRAAGVSVSMLTGDNLCTATALAAQAAITDVHAELHPTDKAALIEQLRATHRGAVAMVGDGVNDAPAMATADVGIAMGAMGTDVECNVAVSLRSVSSGWPRWS